MPLVSTPAILLRSHPFSDSSRVLRFFTRERGLIGVMARGVRRAGTRRGASLELFATGQLLLHHRQGRDLQSFREFSVTDDHRAIAADLTRFAGAALLADLVLHHAGEEANPELFDGLDEAYQRLAAASREEATGLVLCTAWVVVALLGYAPELHMCVHCGEGLGREEMGRFDYAAGGVRCERCGRDLDGSPRVGPRSREQLARLVAGEPPTSLEQPGAHVAVLRDFVTYHITGSRPLPSFGFLQDIVAR